MQTGKVVSVHICTADVEKTATAIRLEVALDGIVADRHRGHSRGTWEGDKQALGTRRRNERQWSAVSQEELTAVSAALNLAQPLLAATLSANLCLAGIPDLSRLPRGTLLRFSSGAVLMVEEYNPPCIDMSKKVAALHTTIAGEPLADNAFSQAAKFSRGLVGVVEAAGGIAVGDEVRVEPEKLPKWLRH